MNRYAFKQVLFLVLFAFVLLILMGFILTTSAKAQNPLMRLVPQDWEWDDDWNDDWDSEKARIYDIRFNRVEGLYLGFRIREEVMRRRYTQRPFLYGFGGYSFGARELEYQLGLEKGFFNNFRLGFGGEYHRHIDTPDHWIMPDWENSLAAFFVREDYHDFYSNEGWSVYTIQNLGDPISLQVGYHSATFDPIERNTRWSLLLAGKRQFPINPQMDSGDLRSIRSRFVWDTRNSETKTTRGWYLEIEHEHAGSDLGGDFKFNRLMLDIRHFQPLGFDDGIDFRIRTGTSEGTLPWQRRYYLGGVSTLRGFPYKFFPNGRLLPGGNRMVLMQVELRMGMQDLPDELSLGILDYFHLILFLDAGWIATVNEDVSLFKGFQTLKWNCLKTDIGMALANRTGNVRFQIARRTDTGDKPWVFTIRLSRPF
jgi:outer membrane protein assembly factor BamA